MGTRSTVVAALLLTLAPLSRARAEGPSPSDQLTAIAEFTAGRTLFEAGDCKGAIPHFVASLKREQSVGARFNLAECSAREGREADARNHYQAAEQLAIRKGDRHRADLAHAAAADLEPRVTTVRVVLPADLPVSFTIDGVMLDVTDHWLLARGYALEPRSAHTLVAEAPGKATWLRLDVRSDPGVELPAFVVDFGPPIERSAGPPRAPREGTSSNALRTTSFVGIGAGVAALATGGVFAVLASSSRSDAADACASGEGFSYPAMCNPLRRGDVISANASARTEAAVATVAIVSGALLVSAAMVLFFVSGSKSTSATSRAFRPLSGTF